MRERKPSEWRTIRAIRRSTSTKLSAVRDAINNGAKDLLIPAKEDWLTAVLASKREITPRSSVKPGKALFGIPAFSPQSSLSFKGGASAYRIATYILLGISGAALVILLKLLAR